MQLTFIPSTSCKYTELVDGYLNEDTADLRLNTGQMAYKKIFSSNLEEILRILAKQLTEPKKPYADPKQREGR